jgi:hypothetical protein
VIDVAWLRRNLSPDDLVSVVGYVALVVLTRVANPRMAIAAASLLASGMLAVFWLVSTSARARNADRHPNARIVIWAAVAIVSGTVLATA